MSLIDGETMSQLFEGYHCSAWRLEVQPVYTMPDEQPGLARFLAGKPKPAGHNADWHRVVRSYVGEGKTMGRVRVVRYPLTDYQRYQLAWGIPGNIEAGEDIRILDLTGGGLELPRQDFWMFDRSIVVHLNFNQDGTFRGRERIDEPDLDKYLRWQDIALTHSLPLADHART